MTATTDPKPIELAALRVLARAACRAGVEVRLRLVDTLTYCRIIAVERDAIVVRDRGARRGEERVFFDAVRAIEPLPGSATTEHAGGRE